MKIEDNIYNELLELVNWNEISKNKELSDEFILEYKDKLNFELLCDSIKLSEDMIRQLDEYVDWNIISKYYKPFTAEFYIQYKDKLNWFNVCNNNRCLSESVIEECSEFMDWCALSECVKLTEDFVRKHEDKISWNNLSGNLECKFSLDFISEYKDKWNWYYICDYYSLPEDFIRQHIDYINWYSISRYRILSSQLIRDFADKVDWKGISIQPYLDINLIKDYPDKVCWKYIFYNWYINDFEGYVDIIKENVEYIDFFDVCHSASSKMEKKVYKFFEWDKISKDTRLINDTEFLKRYKHKLNWNIVLDTIQVPEDVIWYCCNFVDMKQVCSTQKLSLEFIDKHFLYGQFAAQLVNNNNIDIETQRVLKNRYSSKAW